MYNVHIDNIASTVIIFTTFSGCWYRVELFFITIIIIILIIYTFSSILCRIIQDHFFLFLCRSLFIEEFKGAVGSPASSILKKKVMNEG